MTGSWHTSKSVRISHADELGLPSHPAKCLTPEALLPGLAGFTQRDVRSITAMSRQFDAKSCVAWRLRLAAGRVTCMHL